MYNVGDKITVKDLFGRKHEAEIININEWREPSIRYCVDIEGFPYYVFIGEEQIIKKGSQ